MAGYFSHSHFLSSFLFFFFFPSWQFEKYPILLPLYLGYTSHHVPEGLFLFTTNNGFPSLFLSYVSLTHCGIQAQRRDISWHRDPAVNLSTVDSEHFDSSKCCVNAFVKKYLLNCTSWQWGEPRVMSPYVCSLALFPCHLCLNEGSH